MMSGSRLRSSLRFVIDYRQKRSKLGVGSLRMEDNFKINCCPVMFH